MKHKLFWGTCATVLSHTLPAVAQTTPFPVIEYLDVNNIKAGQLVHGDMWYNPSDSQPSCEYPKGSGKHASYGGSIWMSGIDSKGKLHTAAALYQHGNDYWPGPLPASGSLSYAASRDWARIWKIERKDITDFLSLATPTLLTIPERVLQWPAKGNVYARGYAGAGLVVDQPMAPFVDVDADGVYDPLKGDYPDMKGDQMLWWVFNDDGPVHDLSNGAPFRIEYQAMAYGYKRGTAVDNILFYEFKMHNRSVEKYDQFRFGLFSDADLGYAFDDYISFDSSHRMGIEYNGATADGPNGANSYGATPPMTGLSFMQMPGDDYPLMLPAGSFNGTYVDGIGRPPAADTEFHHYLHARDLDGKPLPGGDFIYPITPGESECDKHTSPGDRRYVITSGDYSFQPGTVATIAMAFMVTDTKVAHSCPVTNFKAITDLADTAWSVFYKPLPVLGVGELQLPGGFLNVYPNPATNKLQVSVTGVTAAKSLPFIVYDVTGRRIPLAFIPDGAAYSADISALPSGVYSLVYDNGEHRHAQTFVKR